MSKRYTKDHEWVRMEGDVATVGISAYAAEQLGDVVYVELPGVNKEIARGADMAVVESAKAASDVYAPIAGSVVEVNEALNEMPQLVNEQAEKDGWFVKLRPTNNTDVLNLMSEAEYAEYVKGLG